jgi:hypothetical protein
MYAKVKELPQSLQRALASLGYCKSDVSVTGVETTSLHSLGGDGYRSYACIVNLSTGRFETTLGSWGGPNMFAPTNPVDMDRNSYVIPADGAVILGHEGGNQPVSASIYVAPATLAPMLPTGPTLTEVEQSAINIVGSTISSYRKEAFARAHVTPAVLDGLVSKGLLKRNKAGAISITTEGKNARTRGY